jgi:hypothetical protein
MRGRPQLPDSPQKLTRIIDINWEHGGVVPSSWFEKNTLLVTFDRKLREARNTDYPGPYGVNQATFVVEYGGGTGFEDLDFVPFASPPSLSADGLTAEYEIRPEGSRYRYSYLEKHVIWITIKCDFLLDCHGVRVDGNDNGVAGGTFESWFYVVSDSEYERMRREEDYENPEEEEEPARRQNPEPPRRAADYRQTLRDNQPRQSREGR